MLPFRRRILLEAIKAFNVLVMVLCLALVTVATYYQIGTVSLLQFLSIRVKVQNFLLFLGFLVVWHIMFSLCGLYRSRRFSSRLAEGIDVLKATSLATAVFFGAAVLFRIQMITPVFILAFWTRSNAIVILAGSCLDMDSR